VQEEEEIARADSVLVAVAAVSAEIVRVVMVAAEDTVVTTRKWVPPESSNLLTEVKVDVDVVAVLAEIVKVATAAAADTEVTAKAAVMVVVAVMAVTAKAVAAVMAVTVKAVAADMVATVKAVVLAAAEVNTEDQNVVHSDVVKDLNKTIKIK